MQHFPRLVGKHTAFKVDPSSQAYRASERQRMRETAVEQARVNEERESHVNHRNMSFFWILCNIFLLLRLCVCVCMCVCVCVLSVKLIHVTQQKSRGIAYKHSVM